MSNGAVAVRGETANRSEEMNGTPTVRLEVQSMRYTVMHAIQERSAEFQAAVDEALTKAFESFDLGEFIVSEVRRQMSNSIKTALTHAMSFEMEKYFQDKIRRIIEAHLDRTGLG